MTLQSRNCILISLFIILIHMQTLLAQTSDSNQGNLFGVNLWQTDNANSPYHMWNVNTGSLGIFRKPVGEAQVEIGGTTYFGKPVGIGCMPMNNCLAVNGEANFFGTVRVSGELRADLIRVTEDAFPDYVFKPGYKIPTLLEIEQYINKNHHLPGFPTQEEVQKTGMDVGTMQVKLLEKIEVMTLQMIAMQKEINALKSAAREAQ